MAAPDKSLILLLEAVKPLLSYSAIIPHIPPSRPSQRWQKWHAYVRACDSEVLYFMPSAFQQKTEHRAAGVRSHTRPGGAPGAWKQGAGPSPHPGYTQTARQIWSSAPQHTSETRRYLFQLSASHCWSGLFLFFFFTRRNPTDGGLFLAEAQSSQPLPPPPPQTRSEQQTQDLVVVNTFLHEIQAENVTKHSPSVSFPPV